MSDFTEKAQLLLRAELRRLEIQQHDALERNIHFMVAGAFGFGALVFANIATFLILSDQIGTVPATVVNAVFLLLVAGLLVWRGRRVNSKREAELADEMARLARAGVEQELSEVTQLVRAVTTDIRGLTSLGSNPAGLVGLLATLGTQLVPLLQKRKS